MELQHEELLSALRDAEEFISLTLLNETLSARAQRRRQELEIKLKTLTKRSNIQEEEEQEFYDDVRENDIEPDNVSLPKQVLKVEGLPNESTEDFPQENYEVMSSTVENPTEEIYDDTIPEEEPSKDEIYDDTIPDEETSKDEDTEVYEVAEPQTDEVETEETYDGVEENKSVDSLDIHDKSGTQELESLMKPIKPEDVGGVILKGYLEKHRKRGIYIGSKWQKRYCVLRSFVLYYYSGENAPSQKGSIILHGYTVTRKANKKEFILTRGEDRSYVFMAKSKEDAEKWMEAIKKAASTNKISNRQSEILEQLRLSGEGEEDTASINYDDVANGANNSPFETFDETYDDVGQQNDTNVDLDPGDAQDFYEAPDENPPERPPSLQPLQPPASGIESSPPQPIRPCKPPPPPADLSLEDDQEMYDDVGPDAILPPQSEKPSQPVSEIQPPDDDDEELYDDVGVSQPPPPQPERPKRPVSEIRPTTEEEEEELYDDVGIQGSDVQPVESKPPVPERHLPPVPSNDSRPSPPMPRIPLPPTPNEAPKPSIPPRTTPQEFSSPAAQENNNAPPPTPPSEDKINKAPPPLPPEEETEEQEIDHNCIYQALWDCKPDAEDELEFCRGDLLYIYEKPHVDWWIGSRFKPQGYVTLLIPTNFIMQAYDV